MRMRENENISQYSKRIKTSVSAIRAAWGKMDDVTMVSKVRRTLLPIYAIRVSAIQEMRCDPNNDINLDSLVGRLTTFELDNFDNYVQNSSGIEFASQDKLSLSKKGGKSKGKKIDNEEDTFDDDIEAIEALLARRFSKCKGKFKGKTPLICFSCEEVGHIAARCRNREEKEEKKYNKYKGKKYFKSYKDYKIKGKKSCYMAKDSDSDDEDEMAYISIKHELDDEENENNVPHFSF